MNEQHVARTSNTKLLRDALQKIAYEPWVHPEATHAEVLEAITVFARAVLRDVPAHETNEPLIDWKASHEEALRQRDALTADAERYRFLRNHTWVEAYWIDGAGGVDTKTRVTGCVDHLDLAVDMERIKEHPRAELKASETWIAGDGPCNCGVTSARPWHLPGCSSLTPSSSKASEQSLGWVCDNCGSRNLIMNLHCGCGRAAQNGSEQR